MKARYGRIGDRDRLLGAYLLKPHLDHRSATAPDISTPHNSEPYFPSRAACIRLNHERLSQCFQFSVSIEWLHGLIGRYEHRSWCAGQQNCINDIGCAIDVRLCEFVSLPLARAHSLQRSSMNDNRCTVYGTDQLAKIAHVAQNKRQARVGKLALHLFLLGFVARYDSDLGIGIRQKISRERLPKAACATCYHDAPIGTVWLIGCHLSMSVSTCDPNSPSANI